MLTLSAGSVASHSPHLLGRFRPPERPLCFPVRAPVPSSPVHHLPFGALHRGGLLQHPPEALGAAGSRQETSQAVSAVERRGEGPLCSAHGQLHVSKAPKIGRASDERGLRGDLWMQMFGYKYRRRGRLAGCAGGFGHFCCQTRPGA